MMAIEGTGENSMNATGTREHMAVIDPNDRKSVQHPTAGEEWERAHLPIIILGILGVGGLGTVMAMIYILSPFFARI